MAQLSTPWGATILLLGLGCAVAPVVPSPTEQELEAQRRVVESRREPLAQCLEKALAAGPLKVRRKAFGLSTAKGPPGEGALEGLVACVRARVKPSPEFETMFFVNPESTPDPGPLAVHARPLATVEGITLSYDVGVLVAPRKKSGPDPEYTPEALSHRVEGTLLMRCTIDRSGTPRDCRILKGLDFMNDAAVKAVEARRYEPGRWQGEPVDLEQTFAIIFQLPR